MSLYSYKGIKPEIGSGVYIAPSADIIGKVLPERVMRLKWKGETLTEIDPDIF